MPEPAAWRNCASFLLRHGYRSEEVSQALAMARNQQLGPIALLALEYAPAIARTPFQRALRSPFPYSRNVAAAALAILDESWSRLELIKVLNESSDERATAECRAALDCSRSSDARQAVLGWEGRNSEAAERRSQNSVTQLIESNRDSWLQYEMAGLHDRVIALRGRVQ
jgi:hypothetical protein